MIALAFVWLSLLVLELVSGEKRWMQIASNSIWAIFCIDFLIRLSIAPSKRRYLKRNLLTALSLVLPALRVFRLFSIWRLVRLARFTRSLRLLRVVSSVNRGMRALALTMRQRGFGYVVALTLLVTAVGAAGMLAFEKDAGKHSGIQSYAEALWWTAMLMTTMGSEYWPKTTEGRMLCLFLAVYAFAVFGYVTATIATFFIGKDAQRDKAEAVNQESVELLRKEIAALRQQLQSQSQSKS